MNKNCPICNTPLASALGDGINPLNGVTVYCPTPLAVCPMDSAGHGKNEADALEVYVQKCTKGKE